jgi:hypothetical protein
VRVHETPWANFRFPDADEVAGLVGELEIDVLIVGPLTRVGMDELGTLQQVRDFMARVEEFRARTGRRLTVVLIHHENKGGTVSGAWEGAGDTLLHATVHARGKTTLHVQKARWSSRRHRETLELDWTEGEGFERVDPAERDLIAEIQEWLLTQPHSTAKEIATKKKVKRENGTTDATIPGIGANETTVRELLEARQDLFRVRTGDEAKEVGRVAQAHVWEVRPGTPQNRAENPAHSGALPPAGVSGERSAPVRRPYRERTGHGALTPESQNHSALSGDTGAVHFLSGCVSHPDGPVPSCRYCNPTTEGAAK